MTRVLTVPATHPYVDAVLPAGTAAVARGRVSGWDRDPVFETGVHDADVVHVHFGYDHVDPERLAAWADALGRPLVVTVHDLRNPHHDTRERHDAQLGALLGRAAEVLTLTAGAAAEVGARFGRPARVVPHPAIHAGPTCDTEPGLVGIALKSLRRNVVAPLPIAAATARGAAEAGGRLHVTAHDGVDPALLAAVAALPVTTVDVHPRLDDTGHQAYLSRLHVSVLPYRWGTHSGWLEACRDVGTAVVAPTCGHHREQWPEISLYGWDEHRELDDRSLAGAVASSLRRPPPAPVARAVRDQQLAHARAVHAEVYERLASRAAA